IPIFRALAPAAFLGTFNFATGWVYVSLGRTRRQLTWGIFSSIMLALAFAVGLRWGPTGVATAYSAVLLLIRFPGIAFCYRISPLRMNDLWIAIWRPSLTSIAAGAALFGVHFLYEVEANVALSLVLDFFAYVIFYLVIWVSLPHGIKSVRDLVDIAKELRPAH
ncbi:MAG: lipopolysaccharide biosynthesis protein, partial [Candidatus Latescibacterota bacterium]